jgi:tetratricopeptide (TPR) repeat protein
MGHQRQGRYGKALEAVEEGLRIAEKIGHSQWSGACLFALGTIQVDLLEYDAAVGSLEKAREFAVALGSNLWISLISSFLCISLVRAGEYDDAEQILETIRHHEPSSTALFQILAMFAQGELALAKNEPARAKRYSDRIVAFSSATGGGSGEVRLAPAVALQRARVLAGLGHTSDAEMAFLKSIDVSREHNLPPLIWRALGTYGAWLRMQEREEEAGACIAEALAIVRELADTVPDEGERKAFIRRADRRILLGWSQ